MGRTTIAKLRKSISPNITRPVSLPPLYLAERNTQEKMLLVIYSFEYVFFFSNIIIIIIIFIIYIVVTTIIKKNSHQHRNNTPNPFKVMHFFLYCCQKW